MTILEKKVIITYHEICRAISFMEHEYKNEINEHETKQYEKYHTMLKKKRFIKENYIEFIDDVSGANALIDELDTKFDCANLVEKLEELTYSSGSKGFNEAIMELKSNHELKGKLDYFIKYRSDSEAIAYLCQYGNFDKLAAYDIVKLANCGELKYYL